MPPVRGDHQPCVSLFQCSVLRELWAGLGGEYIITRLPFSCSSRCSAPRLSILAPRSPPRVGRRGLLVITRLLVAQREQEVTCQFIGGAVRAGGSSAPQFSSYPQVVFRIITK